jgi:predicted enzyme related to lactoylglutathione lyase
MPTITHFDIPADDIERAKKFYSDLFGWKIEKAPGPMDYLFVYTKNEKGEDGVGGGIAKRDKPEEKITNFIDVPSIDEYMTKVKELGGQVITPKMPVPGYGFLAVCIDTENNTFGLWETYENAE